MTPTRQIIPSGDPSGTSFSPTKQANADAQLELQRLSSQLAEKEAALMEAARTQADMKYEATEREARARGEREEAAIVLGKAWPIFSATS